jgi:hypothetical protein
MVDVAHAGADAVERELRFFDRMQDAKKPPFQTGHGWREVDGGVSVLAARSWSSRKIWVKAIIKTLFSHFQVSRETPKPNTRIRHITLAIDDFCLPYGQHIPTEMLRNILSEVPAHWSIFGCFEAGFFYNLSPEKGSRKPGFSWHVHFFVWGVPLAEIKAWVAHVNTLVSGVAGLPAAVQKPVGPKTFARKAAYLFKPPLKQYHVLPPLPDAHGNPVYKIRSRAAWPKNLVRSWRQLKDRTLDDLTFGRGEGALVLSRVKQRAAELIDEARGL